MVNLVDPEVVPEQFHKHSELVGDENKPIISMMSRESVDAYALSMLSILATDYIQKRRGQALLFSFEYNLLPNLISNFNHYMDRA